MQREREIQDQHQVRLKDVTEEGALPNRTQPRRGRKRLVMICALCALLAATAMGGYLFLRGKEVQVKASRKAAEKITSGSDLQKAAYDSLNGSLNGSATGVSTTATANNIGSGQRADVAMAGVTPSPASVVEKERAPKIPAPAQPGIAMTIAPPAEALLSKPSKTVDLNQTAAEMSRPENSDVRTSGIASASGKPKTEASILFSVPSATAPVAQNDKLKSAAAKATKVLTPAGERTNGANGDKPGLRKAPATPSFGAMLPVRLMGVLYTLRQGSLARLELVRDIKNERWALKRGAIFVGSLLGSELDRAYVQIKGYIDPETNGFTPLEGELLGSDGGAGLRGKQRRISPVWVKVLDRAAQAGTQILTSVLGRGNSSIIVAADPYGTFRTTPESQNNRSFVEVPAGAVGFVLVTALPAPNKPDSNLAGSDSPGNDKAGELSDAELAQLFADADAEQIKLALPRMNPELRRVAEAALREIETGNKPKGR
jgi:hypothetical protein